MSQPIVKTQFAKLKGDAICLVFGILPSSDLFRVIMRVCREWQQILMTNPLAWPKYLELPDSSPNVVYPWEYVTRVRITKLKIVIVPQFGIVQDFLKPKITTSLTAKKSFGHDKELFETEKWRIITSRQTRSISMIPSPLFEVRLVV
jgi:hypothetical protein